MSSTAYNAIGHINLNSGASLITNSTTNNGSYQGYQFIGNVTVGGTSGSSIISSNNQPNELLGASAGGTTFNVATTGEAVPI